jgi:hypothetical protein
MLVWSRSASIDSRLASLNIIVDRKNGRGVKLRGRKLSYSNEPSPNTFSQEPVEILTS